MECETSNSTLVFLESLSFIEFIQGYLEYDSDDDERFIIQEKSTEDI